MLVFVFAVVNQQTSFSKDKQQKRQDTKRNAKKARASTAEFVLFGPADVARRGGARYATPGPPRP